MSARDATEEPSPAPRGRTASTRVSPLTGTAGRIDLPQYYDEAEIRRRAAARPAPSGVQVIADYSLKEKTNRFEGEQREQFESALNEWGEDADPETMNQFDSTIEAIREPDFTYRWMNPDLVGGTAGKGWRGWQPIEDPATGGYVTVAGQIAAKMPVKRAQARLLKRSHAAKEQARMQSQMVSDVAQRIFADSGGKAGPIPMSEAERITGSGSGGR